MTLSLDTNVVVDFLRGRQPQVRDRLDAAKANGAVLKISTIVVHELIYGALKSLAPEPRRQELDVFLSTAETEPITALDAAAAAAARARLTSRGVDLSLADLLIGSQAQARGWIVVSNNIRHLGHIEAATFMDWRHSDAPLTKEEVASRLAPPVRT